MLRDRRISPAAQACITALEQATRDLFKPNQLPNYTEQQMARRALIRHISHLETKVSKMAKLLQPATHTAPLHKD